MSVTAVSVNAYAVQAVNGALELVNSLNLGSKDGRNLLELLAQDVICQR